MLTPADDYPLHQTPDPIAFSGTDRNFYDRFFFNGYCPEEKIFFAMAMGLYPQLNIMDASFCLVIDGHQYNLRASKEMAMDRLDLRVGPLHVALAEPLRRSTITIAANEYGLSGQIEAVARHAPIEEPRFTRRAGPRTLMDYTRLTQNVTWQGEILHEGQTIKVAPDMFLGTRDRSWGIRSIGKADPQPLLPAVPQQFYWLWAPCNFTDYAFFMHTNDDGDGLAWNRRAVLVDILNVKQTHLDRLNITTQYIPGSRRIASIDASMLEEGGQEVVASIVPDGLQFYMQGLGYMHNEWGHGLHHGPLATAFDVLDQNQAEKDLAAGVLHNLHIQTLSRAQVSWQGQDLTGLGVVEQLFIGPHKPSGFRDLLDSVPTP